MKFSSEYIETEYQRRTANRPDKCWGWSFMYVPQATMVTAKVVLVGLNPGGRELNPPRNEWQHEEGVNAYVDEAWAGLEPGQHPLQQQIALLFEAAGVDASEALEFSRGLWQHITSISPARLFLALGKEAGRQIATVIGATYKGSHPVGWGTQVIDKFSNDQGQVVLSLPHLSRFKIFGRGRVRAAEVVAQTVRSLNL